MKKALGLLLTTGLFVCAACNNAHEADTTDHTTQQGGVVEDTTVLDADTTIAPLDTAAVL